jgi:hypothetical protein
MVLNLLLPFEIQTLNKEATLGMVAKKLRKVRVALFAAQLFLHIGERVV